MPNLDLFPRSHVVGVFRGFREGGLEFHADLVLPYRNDFQSVPMHGQFLLVQLETPQEAVLGRITSLSSEGKLTSPSGEDFNIRAVSERREVPEDLREQYLRYRVNIRVLGVLRSLDGKGLTFVASHRRLPHVGSPVAFPSDDVLRRITGHDIDGTPIGHFALGEYIYRQDSERITVEDWMQFRSPEINVRFPVQSLVSRRSFVFARAGFGKSNLTKLLFSTLYEKTPTVAKRGGRHVPVGTIIFDPDGEYFWPDDKGRPGLADVPALREQLVVFTSRRAPSPYYQSFVAGGIKLDIRRLKPADVIAIALGPDRQDQQNVRKLASMNPANWENMVNLIDEHRNQADLKSIAGLLQLDEGRQDMEALAARSNMSRIVHTLHDKSSQLMDMLLSALAAGKLCVVDVSQMRGSQALMLSGLILRRIFDRNQEQYTAAEPKTIPTIAVIEEAQAVLNERGTTAEPYVTWVKEGRKYDLGALLITQQPGSIPPEILSQGDNWFIFHLLSSADLASVRHANAHFSDDILSTLLNEPIPGQGVVWSSVGGTPYPLSVRVFSFEKIHRMQDPDYSAAAVETFASSLRRKHQAILAEAPAAVAVVTNGRAAAARGQVGRAADASSERFRADDTPEAAPPDTTDEDGVDVLASMETQAIEGLRQDAVAMRQLTGAGISWGDVMRVPGRHLPATVDIQERGDLAYNMVPKALDKLLGPRDRGWQSFKVDGKMWVRALQAQESPPQNASDDDPF